MAARSLVALTLLAALVHATASAEELTPQKRDDIKKLFATTGGTKMGAQFAGMITSQLARNLKAVKPGTPDKAFVAVNKDLTALFDDRMSQPGGLIDQVIPVYDRNFTHAEIKELLAFYDTPIGRKVVETLPRVVGESMQIGQAWGQSLGPEIESRVKMALKREGVELPKPVGAADAPGAAPGAAPSGPGLKKK
ncbi:MAG: DUF2059 domain-containing protein [Burkholderiales bacterium]|nr:DUF2059 domain-containing protein [Burkholderiales bacterium]